MLNDSGKDIWTKTVHCQSKNIMHYIMLQTVPTSFTFGIDAMYRQCLSDHESKFFGYNW